MTDIELGAFLSGPRNPEHEALLRLIGASILDPHGAEAEGEPPAENAGREWSDGELNELGHMLVRGLSIEEIAHRLRRDHATSGTNTLAADQFRPLGLSSII